jgi:hypothetical protein
MAAGYQLSGADVSAYRGRRVQVVGTFVQPNAGTTGAVGTTGTAGTTGTTGTAGSAGAATAGTAGTANTLREFRVQSVNPIAGDCPGR